MQAGSYRLFPAQRASLIVVSRRTRSVLTWEVRTFFCAADFAHSVPRQTTAPVRQEPPHKPPAVPKRTEAGGIAEYPSLDEVLDEMNRRNTWKGKPGRYYFSAMMKCFRQAWYKEKGIPCDCGKDPDQCPEHRFDAGKSEPGKSTEDGIRRMYAEVLNFGLVDGPILNDQRFSVPIDVEWEDEVMDEAGKWRREKRRERVHIIGKSDLLVQGDNQSILAFTEIKSPISAFKRKMTDLTTAMGSKVVPLSVAGVTEPENPDGVCSLSQLVQLAIGVKVLKEQGRAPHTARLITVSRSQYRDHIEVLVSPEEIDHLYDLAVWWTTEHHVNLQFDEPPAPRFFEGWACRYCAFAKRCKDQAKKDGVALTMHPVVPGLQRRLDALHGPSEEV